MAKRCQCPHCHTVYRYRDIIRMKGKQQKCYHCHKPFEVQKRWQILPVLIACVIMTAVDLVLLNTSQNVTKTTFVWMIVMDAAVIWLSLLIAPFFTRTTSK